MKSPSLISGTRFALKNTDLFLLPNNPHMLHLGTISYGLREFVVMCNRHDSKTYIEEVVLQGADNKGSVWANLKFIDDDNLAFDLAKFCEEEKVTDMLRVAETLLAQGRAAWVPGNLIR